MMKARFALTLLCTLASLFTLAQPTFSIIFRVENDLTYTVYHNEPLLFTTNLRNETFQKNLRWNISADSWLAKVLADYNAGKLTKEEYDKEVAFVTQDKRPLRADTIGSRLAPWFHQLQFGVMLNGVPQPAWQVAVVGYPRTDSTAILNEDASYSVIHHLRPDQVALLPPATYKMRVQLAGVWSNEVTVKVRKENIPKSVLATEKMRLRLGYYYLDIGNADKALEFGNALVKKNARHIQGLVLRGEAQILKKNYSLALVDFEKALLEHNKKYKTLRHPPEYLVGTIERLKQQ